MLHQGVTEAQIYHALGEAVKEGVGGLQGEAVKVPEIFEEIGQGDDLGQFPEPRRQDGHRIVKPA